MKKTAGIEHMIGGFKSSLGSKHSPLLGLLAQGALLGGAGYLGGRAVGALSPGLHGHRLGLLGAGAGALGAGALNFPELYGRMALHGPKGAITSPYSMGKDAAFFVATEPGSGRTGFGIPVSRATAEIAVDPWLSPIDKAKATALLQSASSGRRSGTVGWPDVTRAAVGAGIGFTAGALFGKVVDGVFGGLDPKTRTRLSQAGAIGGLIANTLGARNDY